MFKIRPVIADDFSSITRLIKNRDELFRVHPSGTFPWTIAQLYHLNEERLDLSVMEENGTVIGFANLYGFQASNHAYIGNVIIDPAHRSRGHGRRLVTYMMGRIFYVHLLSEARISVFADNQSALSLYHSLGFRLYDEELRQSPNGEELRLLHMRLRKDA